MQDWLWATAADLGRGIGRGEIDPVALTETYLAGHCRPPADAPASMPASPPTVPAPRPPPQPCARGPGCGSGRSTGCRCRGRTCSTPPASRPRPAPLLMQGRVPDRDAAVLATATPAGLVCLGKTHMSEIAFSGLGYNPVTATPPNVNDPDAVPGGSSSGAAASVAYGLAAAAIGVGYRRLGAYSGGLERSRRPQDHPWPAVADRRGAAVRDLRHRRPALPQSVEDAALMLAALEGSRPADLAGARLDGARLMILDTIGMDDLRDGPRAGFEDAVARLADAGAVIERARGADLASAPSIWPARSLPPMPGAGGESGSRPRRRRCSSRYLNGFGRVPMSRPASICGPGASCGRSAATMRRRPQAMTR